MHLMSIGIFENVEYDVSRMLFLHTTIAQRNLMAQVFMHSATQFPGLIAPAHVKYSQAT
jgi:hypothetical protein